MLLGSKQKQSVCAGTDTGGGGECCNMSWVINASVIQLALKVQWLWIGAI